MNAVAAPTSNPSRYWDSRVSTWDETTAASPFVMADLDFEKIKSWIPAEAECLSLGVVSRFLRLPNQLTVVDISPSMVQKAELRSCDNHNYVVGDWRTDLATGSEFDVVLGCGSLNVLDSESVSMVLQQVRQCLRNSGLFCIRYFTREAVMKQSPDFVFTSWFQQNPSAGADVAVADLGDKYRQYRGWDGITYSFMSEPDIIYLIERLGFVLADKFYDVYGFPVLKFAIA